MDGDRTGFTDERGQVGADVAVGLVRDGVEVGLSDRMGHLGDENPEDFAARDGVGDAWTIVSEGFSIRALWGSPISISRSNRPGRRSAGSIAFGLFVAAITTTRATCPSPPTSDIPSINVNNVATTLLSTSPPSPPSRFGQTASTSSNTTIHGSLRLASSNTALILSSVSPWYALDNSGPFTTIHEHPGVALLIARARWVFPVPGGP